MRYEEIIVWFDKKYANSTQREIIEKAFSVIKEKSDNYKVGVYIYFFENNRKELYVFDMKNKLLFYLYITKNRNLILGYYGKKHYIGKDISPEVENELFSF